MTKYDILDEIVPQVVVPVMYARSGEANIFSPLSTGSASKLSTAHQKAFGEINKRN